MNHPAWGTDPHRAAHLGGILCCPRTMLPSHGHQRDWELCSSQFLQEFGGFKTLFWLFESSGLYKTFTNKAAPEPRINPELQMQTKEGETKSDKKNHYLQCSWPWTNLTQQPSVSVRRVRWHSYFSCHFNFKSGRVFWCCLFCFFVLAKLFQRHFIQT